MTIVHAFDHFVVPVDDIVAAEDFYTRVFGGEIVKRNGLNVQHRKRGAIPHTFLKIGGKRVGVYLQSDDRPKPTGVRGAPTYSFTTTLKGIDETLKELRQLNVEHEGPIDNARSFTVRSLYFNDLSGNHFEVYVPKEQKKTETETMPGRMTSVGYLELEAPNVEASVRFYQQVLGFELVGYSEDTHQNVRQATMKIPSGQILFLTEVPFTPKGLVLIRTVPGPHIAFYIPPERWEAALAHLDKLGIPNADRGAAKEPKPGRGGTYMDDPGGNVVQYITEGTE